MSAGRKKKDRMTTTAGSRAKLYSAPKDDLENREMLFGDIFIERFGRERKNNLIYRPNDAYDTTDPLILRGYCMGQIVEDDSDSEKSDEQIAHSFNKIIEIPLVVTNEFQNAIEHYQDIIHHDALRGKIIEFCLHPADEGLTEIFGKDILEKHWKSITIQFIDGELHEFYLNIDFGNGIDLHSMSSDIQQQSKYSSLSVKFFKNVYLQLNDTMVTNLCVLWLQRKETPVSTDLKDAFSLPFG